MLDKQLKDRSTIPKEIFPLIGQEINYKKYELLLTHNG